MLAEIKRNLKEPAANGQWTDAELLRRANLFQSRICRDAECLVQLDTTTTSVAAQATYDKPTDCIRLLRVTYAGKRIYGIPREELDLAYGSSVWTALADTPTRYYETHAYIGFYKVPVVTGDTISLDYVCSATAMTLTTSLPFNGDTDLQEAGSDLIISGVTSRCLMEDKDPLYAEWKNEYDINVKKLRMTVKDRSQIIMTGGLITNTQSSVTGPLNLG